MNSIEVNSKFSVAGNYDVVVCGGGPAGFAATVSAARCGAKVLVIEANGCLGGLWTAGLLTWVLDVHNKDGIMKEVEDRLIANGDGAMIEYGDKFSADTESTKLLFENMCCECGADVLYHTYITGVVKEDRKIKYVLTSSKSGNLCFGAKVFIDATGDGDIGYFAGCNYEFGNDDGETQPVSMIAQLNGIKPEDMAPYDDRIGKGRKIAFREQLEKGGANPSYQSTLLAGLCDKNELYALMTSHGYGCKANDAKGLTKATFDGRRELYEHYSALKNLGGIWKDARFIATSDSIGVREGRRIKGLYTVCKEDMECGKTHDDAVCTVCFGSDVHNLKNGSHVQDREKYKVEHKPYQIPARALVSCDVDNLLMAGRCISGDFVSHSSYRVGGNAVKLGEEAGKIAAKCAKDGICAKKMFSKE